MVAANITCFTCQGSKNKRCKDVAYFKETEDIGIFSLADGLNSQKYSDVGARIVQKALAENILNLKEKFWENTREQNQMMGIRTIKEVLDHLAKEEKPRDQYASTLMLVAVNAETKYAVWYHLGDGMLLKKSGDGKLEILSHPQNGITRQYTYTTANGELMRYLRTESVSLAEGDSLIMMTDGAMKPFYQGRRLTAWGEKIISRGEQAIFEALQKLEPADDYSMLEVKF